MSRVPRGRTVELAVAALVLVAALGAAGGEAHATSRVAGTIVLAVEIVLLFVFALVARIVINRDPRVLRRHANPLNVLLSILAAFALPIGLGMLASHQLTPRPGLTHFVGPVPQGHGARPGFGSADQTDGGGGIPWAAVVLSTIGVVAVVVVARRTFATPRTAVDPDVLPDDPVQAAAAAAVRALREPETPREAVIAAYVAMERALADAGLPRGRSETAREYIRGALQRVPPAAAEPAARLSALFERARYSTEPIHAQDRVHAERWLQDVASA